MARLLKQVVAGEEVVILRGGKPVARLVPVREGRRRELGRDRGRFEVPEDFDTSLSEEVLMDFEA